MDTTPKPRSSVRRRRKQRGSSSVGDASGQTFAQTTMDVGSEDAAPSESSELRKIRGELSAMRADMRRIKALLMVGVGFFLLRMLLEGVGQLVKHLG